MIFAVNIYALLTYFFHYIFDVYDESKLMDVIYLDLQKAFNKVPK